MFVVYEDDYLRSGDTKQPMSILQRTTSYYYFTNTLNYVKMVDDEYCLYRSS